MAFSGNFMCTSFKKELMTATHNFTNGTGDVFQIALYTNSATFNAATTAAVFGAGNNEVATSGTTAFTDFANKTFTSATITARGALIYNSSAGAGANTANSVVVLDFGSDKSSTAGDFQIVFPNPDASNALIRIA